MGDCAVDPEQDYVGKTGQAQPPHITKSQNIWPSKAPYFREGLYKYYQAVLPLAMKLVRIFALAFGLEETALDQYFKFPITGMRPLHYPPMPPDTAGDGIGLGAHADFSCMLCHTCKEIQANHNRAHFGSTRDCSSPRSAEPRRHLDKCKPRTRNIGVQCRPISRETE